MRKREQIRELKHERSSHQFGATAAAIAAIVTAAASVGGGIASAVAGGGENEVPANKLTPEQTEVAANLANQFGFGKAGDKLNPNAQLGQGLVESPGSFANRIRTVQQQAQSLGAPNTNRFGLGTPQGTGSASKLSTSFGGK